MYGLNTLLCQVSYLTHLKIQKIAYKYMKIAAIYGWQSKRHAKKKKTIQIASLFWHHQGFQKTLGYLGIKVLKFFIPFCEFIFILKKCVTVKWDWSVVIHGNSSWNKEMKIKYQGTFKYFQKANFIHVYFWGVIGINAFNASAASLRLCHGDILAPC